MSEELYHTSAPRGIRPGSSGFCTVAVTPGVSAALEERLTLLSGYRWIYPPGDANSASRNPVSWAHWRLPLAGRTLSVLSRVADSGVDYSRRSNRFAHHLVLDAAQQIEAGPAWLLRQASVMESRWTGEPLMLPAQRPLPSDPNPPRACSDWAAASGDAGWGGVLAESFLADPGRVAWIVFPPDADLLALFDESLSLIPDVRRWDVTFNTYFTELPAGLSCAWRGCPAGSRTASEAIRNPAGALVIDLTRPAPLVVQTPGATAGRIGTLLPDVGRRRGELPIELIESNPAAPPQRPGQPLRAPVGLLDNVPEPDPLGGADVEAHGGVSAAVAGSNEWMPPESATVIEYARPPRKRRTFHPAVWLLGALLIFIGVGAVIWFIEQSGAQKGAITFVQDTFPDVPASRAPLIPAATAPAIDRHREEIESKLATLTEQNQSLNSSLSAATTQLATLSDKEAQIAKLKAELDEVKASLAATSLPSVAPAPQTHQTLNEEGIRAEARTTKVPAFNVLDDRQSLWQMSAALPAPDRIELAAPDVPAGIVVAKLSPVRISIRPAGKALAVDAAGNIVATDLISVELKNGRLTFEWLDKRRFKLIDQAANWLALSRVSLFHEKNEVAGVQVVAPLNIKLNAADVVAILPDLRGATADALTLLAPLESTPDWTVHATADPLIVGVSNLRYPAAHFDVSVELAGPVGTVRATWRERRAALANQADELAAMDALPPMTFRIRFNSTDVIIATIAMTIDRAPARP